MNPILVVVFLLLSWASVVHCEQRVALVIGNGAYQDARLKNPPSDARAIAEALRECDFRVIEEIDGDKRGMVDAIREFGKQIRRGGVGLFFYAGHGMQVGGTNYLVPVGTDIQKENDVEFECVDANRVLREMEDAGNRINIIILDACRNNPFARSFRSGSRGLKKMDAPTGSLLAYATAPGDVAADGDGTNGLYTSMLLKHMRTPGFSVVQVFQKVGGDVRRASGDSQVPWITMSLTDDFYFVPEVSMASPTPPPTTPPPPTSSAVVGHLQVQVNASQSRVYINDAYHGEASPQSPLNISEVGLGEVEVRVEAKGYKAKSQNFALESNQWTQAVFQLSKIDDDIKKRIEKLDAQIKGASAWGALLLGNAVFFGLPAYDLQSRDKHPKWRNLSGWTGLTFGVLMDFGWILQLKDLKKNKKERAELQRQWENLENSSETETKAEQN